ncbi:MAG TPA: PDZ domain-containing protein [Acidobacteriota bacterium]|nr:PDZ domain-containing protein [Acidobacteriota bacterium]
MSYPKKFGIAFLVLFLACGVLLPLSQAQTRVFSNVPQMSPDGAFLGVQMKDVTADNMSKYKLSSEKGVIVSSVVQGSPAEKANIKEDDVILEFGGFSVWSSSQLARLVQETPAGRKVDMAISRDGKRMSVSATLEGRDQRSAESRGQVYTFPRDWAGPGQRSYEFRLPDMLDNMPNMPGREGNQPATQKARLGVTIQPLTDQLGAFLGVPGKKGVLVASVIEGSPSAGKLKSGDVITGVDGKAVETPDELTRMIRSKAAGDVTLKVIRDKKEISVVVNLAAADEKGYKL